MDTCRWPTLLLLLVALLPSRTLCQTETTTSPTARDGIDSGVSSPALSALGEPVATTTLKPSADSSFVSTTQKTLLEDNDTFNELELQGSDKKASPKSNKALTDRTKTAKFQGDAISVSTPPAPVFTATEVPAPPEDSPKVELRQGHSEDGPVSGYNGPLSYEPVSEDTRLVKDPFSDLPPQPSSPSVDFGGRPGYVSPPEEASVPLVGTDVEGISAPTGDFGAQYADGLEGFPGTYEIFPGTLPPKLGTSAGLAAEEGQGSLHREEENALPSNAGESVSHGDTMLSTTDGVDRPSADAQAVTETPVSSEKQEKPQFYSGPSSFGYGRSELPETSTVPTSANAETTGSSPPVNPVLPSVGNAVEKQSESVDSTLTTPQPETLGASNTVQDALREKKTTEEGETTTTSSLDSIPSGGSDPKTGRSLDLEGEKATASSSTVSVPEDNIFAISSTTSSNNFEVATTSAPETTGAQEVTQGPDGSSYISEAAATSTPKTEETTQLVDATTIEHSADRADQDDSRTMFPDRYRPTSKNGVTTAAPSETSSSVESSTSAPEVTTLSGVVATTEHQETTAAGTTEGVSAFDVHGTASPASSSGTSTVYVPEITTDRPPASTMAPLTTPPETATRLTDGPVAVDDTTTADTSTESTTLLSATSASPAVEPTTTEPKSAEATMTGLITEGSGAEEPTAKAFTPTRPTTAEPTTTNSFAAVSINTDATTTQPTTAWTTTVQPIAPELPTTQPTTAASTTLVLTTTEALTENLTSAESMTTEKTIVDSLTAEGMTTQAPTTAVPTTTAPTTTVPTTEFPTTEFPTTEAPTTEAPTTEAPTSEAPTSEAPTSEVPTTEVPTTEVPTTEVPTTEAPTTASPTAAPTTAVPITAETTTIPSVVSVSTFSSASTSTPETPITPETASTSSETSTTPEDTSVTTSDVFFRPGPHVEEELPTTQADTTPQPPVGETTTGGVSDPWFGVVHSASRNPKQLTHPSTSSSPDQTTPAVTPAATTAVVSDAAFTTVTPLDAFTSSESGEQETTTSFDLFTTLFPEAITRMRAVTTTEAATTTAHVTVVSDNSIETETVATVADDVTCNIEARNLTVACLLPQELNNTVTVKFSEWDHRRTEAFRIEAERRLADYCLRKGIPLGDTTVVFVANEHGMDLISFFVINQTRGSLVPAATLIAFLNETKPTLEDAVNLTINDVFSGLPLMDKKQSSTGLASILGGPFKALYVIIAASLAALLILVVIIVLMIKCRSLSSNQYSPDVEKLTKDLHMRSEIGDLRPGDEILKEEAQLKDASAFVINGNGTHLTRDGDGWVVPYSQVPTEAKNGVPDAQDTRL